MIEPIELRNFLDTVAAMRKTQRAYFAKPGRDLLIDAKRLEAAVDVSLGLLMEKLKLEASDDKD